MAARIDEAVAPGARRSKARSRRRPKETPLFVVRRRRRPWVQRHRYALLALIFVLGLIAGEVWLNRGVVLQSLGAAPQLISDAIADLKG